MLTAQDIILQYVCPLLGCVVANVMFAAPLQDVRQAVRRGTLGSLNPTPWAVMTGNCTGWITYSYLIQNQFVFWANAPGFILSIWLNMAAAKLQYSDRMATSMRASFVQLLDSNRQSLRQHASAKSNAQIHTNFDNLKKTAMALTTQKFEAPAPHEKIVVGVVTVWMVAISTLSFLKLNIEQWKVVIGVMANINTLFFYGAPLTTIVTVLKTRDSSSIHRKTMIMNTLNASFWTAFGFGIMDMVLLIPNGLGALLGFVQIFLCMIAPRRDILTSGETEVQDSLDLAGLNDVEELGVEAMDMEATDEEANHLVAREVKATGKENEGS
ncbi:hypothetical protein ACHAXH_006333 [Discostella pseudostelligera]